MNELFNKGLALYRSGKLKEARNIYEKLLEKDSNNFELLNLVGVISLQLKKYDEAIVLIKKAININSRHHALYNNLGVIYKELEQYDDAIKNFKIAIELNHNYSEAYNNLGIIFKKLNQYKESYNYYKESIRLKPFYAEAYNNLGLLYEEIKNFKDANINFTKAIELKHNYIDAYKNRANLYSRNNEYALAIKDYDKLKILDPNKASFYESHIFFNKNQICDWQNYEENVEKLKNNLKNNKDIFNTRRILFYIDELKVIKNNVSKFNNQEYNLSNIPKIKINNPKKKKIRIGYYSSDFRNHAVSYSLINVLESHNKNDFEIIGFHFSKYVDDEMTKRVSKACNKFFNVSKMSDQDLISQSRNLEIDIAINLNGQTADNRENIFINRVAPVQINFLGYPGTLGNYMDYIIADKYLIPNEKQKFYFEKIIYMPNSFIPHDDSKKNHTNSNYNRKKFNLPESSFIYCCFNSVYKIDPIIFNCWMKILEKTDNTVFCFINADNACKNNLKIEAEKAKIDVSRIIFTPYISYNEIFERYANCDLFLDTFPYGAHSTANEALTSGLPLLTISGESYQSRVSGSLLKSLQIPELVKQNIKDYEDFAIHLANNPSVLKEIKKKLLLSIKNSNAFNTKIYTKNLEKAYKQIYDLNHKNLMPENIYIN
jgi:predicted O-linked N-acetylglucosamine transferase (SPINDLY family)